MADVARQSEIQFAFDVTLDEIRRRRADLDDEQQRIFGELVRAGVLPDRS